MGAAAAFGRILEAISPLVYREQEFIADFLQINEAGLTFADYMGLENYFRRQAARTTGLSQQTLKLIRGAMDLIFGFLPLELKAWIDAALAKDNLYARPCHLLRMSNTSLGNSSVSSLAWSDSLPMLTNVATHSSLTLSTNSTVSSRASSTATLASRSNQSRIRN